MTSPEKQIQGSLNVDTYLSYVSAAGGYCVAFLVVLSFFINVGSTAFSSWWLAVWIQAGSGVSGFGTRLRISERFTSKYTRWKFSDTEMI